MNILRQEGFDFGFDPDACKDCPGYCCRGGSGRVWVTQREIHEICRFLKIHPVDAMGTYFSLIDNRLSVRERFTGQEFECVFFGGAETGCVIYAARPLQCRRFPFWDHFKTHKDQVVQECPGIVE